MRVSVAPANDGGALVHVRMRPSGGTLVTLIVWMGVAFIGFRLPTHAPRSGLALAAATAAVLLGLSTTFAVEAEKTERLLVDLFLSR